ncbi:TIGR02302 family protein [Mesobacterium sp. TK19101]|uniref:TIGR02302 family protein n=1 Tax=Mesobacterium hydrothermale TaxID=3111907 RepID=A0ABU6HFJ6_9RHOB|nr:TIGR02302 family protein [Mesobacterium sp. TK19101]MEC3860892.1 TIGR02302 family protein [Mesobacterium sp. TK19101]
MPQDRLPNEIDKALKWPLALTRAGMVAERITRAFWPLWSVLFVAIGALFLGLHDMVAVETVWIVGAVLALLAIAALVRGVMVFRWPSRAGALDRLDATMAGRPIRAALDTQAIGSDDPASNAVWQAYQARMRDRLAQAKPVEPDLRVARADPFALRYVALLVLASGLLFGSVIRVGSVTTLTPNGKSLATGPVWEGWLEPPGYTRLPAIYLNDITAASLDAPEGSRITLRLYGAVGALSVAETVTGQPQPEGEVDQPTAQEFVVRQSGEIAITGDGGRSWQIAMIPDTAPTVILDGEIEVSYEGEANIPFTAKDDYGVVEGTARIDLALDQVDRRYGLKIDPEMRDAITLPLPMPISGSRADFTESLIDNFSEHAWANLPVTLTLIAQDAAGNTGNTPPDVITLPGRRFFDPLAAAIIEQRRALLWSRANAKPVVQVMRAISNRPDDVFRSAVTYLRFKTILTRLERYAEHDMTLEQQDELSMALWDLALLLEEGDLQDALERLQRAQDRLTEAMKNGASDQEIAELMQELREATDDYLRKLAQQNQRDAEQNPEFAEGMDQDMMQMTQNDLQEMMDRIQELMEQGRMAEAMEAMEQLRQLMENMQVTQGQGQGQPSPGQQAMEGLAETLRDQQGLSDEAFRDLQQQFNQPNPGQQGQQGQQGEQQGQGQQGQQQGQGQQPGTDQQGGQGTQQSLADRQRGLRQELNRQRNNLPGLGGEAGERARDSLGRAEDAMDGAEEALRQGDLAEAIDRQSEAMEALREGMRDLGEALAQEQQNQGQQGTADGTDPGEQRDPLGRSAGSNGQIGTDENLLQGEDVYRRARELLDEIRRRTGDGERPEAELEYLERLLDRF